VSQINIGNKIYVVERHFKNIRALVEAVSTVVKNAAAEQEELSEITA
jgi:hypothetical protein